MERIDDTRQGGITKIKRHVDPRDRPIPKPKSLVPEPEAPTRKYKTLIRNNNPELTIKIPMPSDFSGPRWTHVSPGTEIEISFSDKDYFLAPYREIEYRKNNKIMLGKRKGYKEKTEDFVCEFLNTMENSVALEVWPGDGMMPPIYCVRGIPIKRRYPASSPWAIFRSITFAKPIVRQEIDLAHPGRLKSVAVCNVIKVKHDKKTLEKIDALRRAIALHSYGLDKE